MMQGNGNIGKKKKSGGSGWLIFLLVIGFLNAAADAREGLIAIAAILLVIALIAVLVKRKKARKADDSHDQFNQKRDYKINASTGKVSNRQTQPRKVHSSEQHWKEQLDNLLANGTIDREEYNTMLRQHRK